MKKTLIKKIVFIMMAVIAIGSITYGILSGGYGDVKNKAVRICNECIGLG